MLTLKQVKEIREHLEKAQRPVFFFDNDQDGLCSFLLLQRFIGRGKGVAIKSYPALDANYFRKVQELNADYVFILDKPVVSEEFWKEIEQVNLPVVWIDHHDLNGSELDIPEFVNYYNPVFNKVKSSEPVTALCYQVTNKKEDLWLAVVGCCADNYLPDFYKEFLKKYPDLGVDTKIAFEVVYNSRIGDVGKMLSAGLKDTMTNVVNMFNFLIKVKSPYEVLEESSKNRRLHERYNFINKKYQLLLERALENRKDKFLFFKYSGDLSISGELSNELYYMFPKKMTVVAYVKGAKINISARGKNVKKIILKALEGLEATGGGHDNAVGAQVREEDFEIFRERVGALI